MDNTINGRTSEEIKKWLVEAIEEANWVVEGGDAHDLIDAVEKAHASMADALALINQLQEDKKQLERERDAAVADMYHAASDGGSFCDICKYKGEPCDERKAAEMECWQWRGVQEV